LRVKSGPNGLKIPRPSGLAGSSPALGIVLPPVLSQRTPVDYDAPPATRSVSDLAEPRSTPKDLMAVVPVLLPCPVRPVIQECGRSRGLVREPTAEPSARCGCAT
jgi:hypothetical protein